MFRCYCNQCENGGYFEPNYDSARTLAEFDAGAEPAEFDAGDLLPEFQAGFVGPLQPWFIFGEMNDPIPF